MMIHFEKNEYLALLWSQGEFAVIIMNFPRVSHIDFQPATLVTIGWVAGEPLQHFATFLLRHFSEVSVRKFCKQTIPIQIVLWEGGVQIDVK